MKAQQIRQLYEEQAPWLQRLEQVKLPEGLSATEGRILAALAEQDGLTARALIKRMGMDAGYLSRILAGFEQAKLLRRAPNPRDRRASLLTLTARGKAVALAIDTALETHCQPLPKKSADGRAIHFRPLQLGDAGWIIHRHGALIAVDHGWDIRFEALAAQIMADFIRNYDASCERSWVVERDGTILGSLLLVRDDAQTARLRLLYVEPEARGLGLATRLIERSISFARAKGYQQLRLFTTHSNISARNIYERLGFIKISEAPSGLFGQGLIGETWELAL